MECGRAEDIFLTTVCADADQPDTWLGLYTGLGWELNQKRYMGNYCSGQTIGKTGFTGCVCMCDVQGSGNGLLSTITFLRDSLICSNRQRAERHFAEIIFSIK